MASSSTVEGNSNTVMDIRFMLRQCKYRELADVKIMKSNKNNNRGRIYYMCKRQRCGSFLGWYKVSLMQYASNTICPQFEQSSISRDSVVGEVNAKREVPWKFLIAISFIFSTFLVIKSHDVMHLLL